MNTMTDRVDMRARMVRIVIALSVAMYLMALWVNRGKAFRDFTVLHYGAGLVGDDRAAVAYDSESFIAEAATRPELADSIGGVDVFLSTPTFALAMRPIAALPLNVAIATWIALGVLAVFAAVRLLRLPAWAGLIAMLVPFGLANNYHAQTGFMALIWAAGIHRLVLEDKIVPAGLLAGLAVLKPPLLLGVAIWWLLDWRRWYPALLSAAAVGTAIVAPTVMGGFETWRLFLEANSARADLGLQVVANQPTISELVNRLSDTATSVHPVAILAYLAVGAVIMREVLRRWPDRRDVISGSAMIVSMLISPHLLVYDTSFVLIAFAVAVHAGVSTNRRELLIAIYVVAGLMSLLSSEPFGTINEYVSPATIGMMIAGAAWLSFVTDDRTATAATVDSLGSQPADSTTLPEAA